MMKVSDKRLMVGLGFSLLLHALLLLLARGGALQFKESVTGAANTIAVHLVAREASRPETVPELQTAVMTAAASNFKLPEQEAPVQQEAVAVKPKAEDGSKQAPVERANAAQTAESSGAPTGVAIPSAISLPWLIGDMRPVSQSSQNMQYYREMNQMREKQQAERQTQQVSSQLYRRLLDRLDERGGKQKGRCDIKTAGDISRLACKPAALEHALRAEEADIVASLNALHKENAAVSGFTVFVRDGRVDVTFDAIAPKGGQ